MPEQLSDPESTNLVFGAGISGCVALEELNCADCDNLTSLGGAKSACLDSACERCLNDSGSARIVVLIQRALTLYLVQA